MIPTALPLALLAAVTFAGDARAQTPAPGAAATEPRCEQFEVLMTSEKNLRVQLGVAMARKASWAEWCGVVKPWVETVERVVAFAEQHGATCRIEPDIVAPITASVEKFKALRKKMMAPDQISCPTSPGPRPDWMRPGWEPMRQG